jgi:predicted SnoaL-like aldol condensation-catalyzing enzyme
MSADNKTLVKTALAQLFGQRDPGALGRYFAEPYPQHNPQIPDGLRALEPLLGQTESYETKRLLGEGDFVVTHSIARGWGPTPMVVFDIFLVRDGRIREHWDVMQPVADKTVSGLSQTDGETEVADRDKTAENKALVEGFFDEVLYGGKGDRITRFINPKKYLQHNPGVGNGLEGFGQAMAELAKAGLKMAYQKTYRVIADGNFVFTHSEGEFAGRHVAFADLFRLEHGLIVEHWDCIQDVPPPEQSANRNGMFAQVTR